MRSGEPLLSLWLLSSVLPELRSELQDVAAGRAGQERQDVVQVTPGLDVVELAAVDNSRGMASTRAKSMKMPRSRVRERSLQSSLNGSHRSMAVSSNDVRVWKATLQVNNADAGDAVRRVVALHWHILQASSTHAAARLSLKVWFRVVTDAGESCVAAECRAASTCAGANSVAWLLCQAVEEASVDSARES